MFLSAFNLRVDTKGAIGFTPVTEDTILEIREQVIEDFEGTVLYGELREHVGNQSYCIEKFKTIVEPPTKWEKFIGITLEGKIKKAAKKMRQQAERYATTGSKEGANSLLGMIVSII